MGKKTYAGQTYWYLKNWDKYYDRVEPNSNKLSWKFTNPDKIQFDKFFVKVSRVEKFDDWKWHEVKGRWKIEIDGEQTDVTFDHNYEAEIKGKGFKKITYV